MTSVATCAKEASLLEVLGYVSHISVRQPSQQVPTYQNGHQQSSRQPILSINIQNEVLPNVDHGREFEIKMLSQLNGYFSVNGRKIVSKFSKYQILPLYTTKLKFLWHTFFTSSRECPPMLSPIQCLQLLSNSEKLDGHMGWDTLYSNMWYE